MKSVFLASVSHELRTPLNGILGFAELLKLDLKDPAQQSYAETIHRSGKHLLDLVNDLLDLAKIEAGRMELKSLETDIRTLVKGVAAIHGVHAESKGIKLLEHYADNLPDHLFCDPTRLRQILNNLLNNAVKFTSQGTIDLTVEQCENYIRFTISDTGIGIPQEQQHRIFEKFHQADNFLTSEQGGSGLGLALAKELVMLMGGEMGFKSTQGDGSVFFFTVPLP